MYFNFEFNAHLSKCEHSARKLENMRNVLTNFKTTNENETI